LDRLTRRIGDGIVLTDCKTIFGTRERKGAGLTSAIVRLAAYEDTGLTPGDVKDLQELCKENGLAEYVDLIVEAKRQMGISNERDIEQNERIEELEAENARLRAELAEQQRETASCDYLLGEADIGARAAGGEIKELRNRLELVERERDKAVEDLNSLGRREKEKCAYCVHDDDCEPGEMLCSYKGAAAFEWRGTEGKA
jgi:hypothetical protein